MYSFSSAIIIMMKTNKGFTLIELLLVVVLVGILSGVLLSIINIDGMRMKARDAQRVADLRKVQLALELYFADNRNYPGNEDWEPVSGVTLTGGLVGKYISVIPWDPSQFGTYNSPCGGSDARDYWYRGDVSGYILATNMEVASSDDPSPCVTLNNWNSPTSFGCGTTQYCYGIENPL